MEHVLQAPAVGHVADKQLYLGRLGFGGLPAPPNWRERGPVAGDLVDGADPLGLRQAGGAGRGGVFAELCGGLEGG